jgi:hypothetical protein
MNSNNESFEKNSIHSNNNNHHTDDIKDDFSELGILSALTASLLEIDDQNILKDSIILKVKS